MGDFPATHSMNEFFIYPTITLNGHNHCKEPPTVSTDLPPPTPPKDYHAFECTQPALKPSRNFKPLDVQPNFSRGYTSDEEVASPIDNDDFSIMSFDSEDDLGTPVLEDSYHAQTCSSAHHLCSRAQAVQVVSAGKAKVVTLPKVINTSGFSRKDSDESSPDILPPASRVDRTLPNASTQYSNSTSNSEHPNYSSDENVAQSAIPSEDTKRPLQRKVVRRKPNLQQLQTVAFSDSTRSISTSAVPRTAVPARQMRFLDSDPFPSRNASRSSASPSPPRSRMRRLSPSFSLRALSRAGRRRTTPDGSSSEDLANSKQLEASERSPTISEMRVTAQTSIRSMPKMIPRGASERAPPIELPPYPDDYVDGVFVPLWPPRKESVAVVSSERKNPSSTVVHSRRMSVSTLVSAQA